MKPYVIGRTAPPLSQVGVVFSFNVSETAKVGNMYLDLIPNYKVNKTLPESKALLKGHRTQSSNMPETVYIIRYYLVIKV